MSNKMLSIVIYGINESQPKTPRVTRQKHDVDAVLAVLSNVDSTLSRSSIQDLHRLGEFNATNPKPRPLLVRFLHTFNVLSILSNRSLAPKDIIIKPYLSREETAIESVYYELDGNYLRKEPTRNVSN